MRLLVIPQIHYISCCFFGILFPREAVGGKVSSLGATQGGLAGKDDAYPSRWWGVSLQRNSVGSRIALFLSDMSIFARITHRFPCRQWQEHVRGLREHTSTHKTMGTRKGEAQAQAWTQAEQTAVRGTHHVRAALHLIPKRQVVLHWSIPPRALLADATPLAHLRAC